MPNLYIFLDFRTQSNLMRANRRMNSILKSHISLFLFLLSHMKLLKQLLLRSFECLHVLPFMPQFLFQRPHSILVIFLRIFNFLLLININFALNVFFFLLNFNSLLLVSQNVFVFNLVLQLGVYLPLQVDFMSICLHFFKSFLSLLSLQRGSLLPLNQDFDLLISLVSLQSVLFVQNPLSSFFVELLYFLNLICSFSCDIDLF